jgi:hypothetical protein
MLVRKIYVSDSGSDKSDGLTSKPPIRSWQRFIGRCHIRLCSEHAHQAAAVIT